MKKDATLEADVEDNVARAGLRLTPPQREAVVEGARRLRRAAELVRAWLEAHDEPR